MANVSSICCLALSLVLKGKVSFAGDAAYTASLGSYFSLQESAVQPHCILSAQTAQDVSVALRVLTKAGGSGCPFAVRSGGHADFAGAANMQSGVTMDLRGLHGLSLLDSSYGHPPVLSVGVGATWGDVYSYLDAANLSVSGGRSAGVGVGGLALGGGIGYFGPRFGWTCDAVTNLEVVLADGSIVDANAAENPDLLWALRGGANNFGVVTRVDLQTFEQGPMWGGYVVSPFSNVDDQMAAMAAFNDPATYDEFASLITTFAYSGAEKLSAIVNNMEYAKNETNPAVFSALASLPQYSSTERITNASSLAMETSESDPDGLRQAGATVTIVSSVAAINATVQAWSESIAMVQNVSNVVWGAVMDVLPPGLYGSHADANALGLGGRNTSQSLIVIHFTATWSDAADDGTVDAASRALIAAVEQDVGAIGALDSFLYVNYAAPWQNPIASYGEASLERLRQVRGRYDPHWVFTRLVPGGFKLP